MANDKPKAPDPKDGNDKGKQPEAGKPEGQAQGDQLKSKSDQDGKADNRIAELEKALKARDGTISALDKKLNSFQKGMKDALGLSNDDDKGDDPITLIAGLRKEIETLKTERQRQKAHDELDKVIDEFRDDKGNPLPENVKRHLRNEVNPTDPDPEKIKGVVEKKVKSLQELLGDRFTFTSSDRRPEGKAFSGAGRADRISDARDLLKEKYPDRYK